MQRLSIETNQETESARAGDERSFLEKEETHHWFELLWIQHRRRIIVGIATVAVLVILITVISIMVSSGSEFTSPIPDRKKLVPPNVETPLPPSPTPLHIFKTASVCSDSELCSKIGRDIFHQNGSVIDSTVATMICNGLVTMQSMGLGGGFFMNIYIKNESKAYTLDARDMSPGVATEEFYSDKNKDFGPLAMTVPGELKGYWEAHKRFGKLPWKYLVQPTIDLCHRGFEMTKHMYDSIHFLNKWKKVETDAELKRMFIDEKTGQIRSQGAMIRPQVICKTYERIAVAGGDDLYNGELAEMFADDLNETGSVITKEDLAAYQVHWSDSVPIEINNYTLFLTPPPSSGFLIGFIMNILKGYNLEPKDLASVPSTVLTYHRMIEAFKYAYAERTFISDPQFRDMSELMKNVTSPEYAEEIRKHIDDSSTKSDPKEYGAEFYLPDKHGTSHISIIAPNGDAVSATSSINFYFGSGTSGRRTGIIGNNGMADFSTRKEKTIFGLPGSEPNFIQPHKRPVSSMSPTIVVDSNKDVEIVIGAAGGTKITSAVTYAIMRYLWFGDDIKQAVDAPRIHHQLVPNEIQYEYGILEPVLDGLEKIGHNTTRYKDRGSVVCGTSKNATGIYANADYRKGGDVVGY